MRVGLILILVVAACLCVLAAGEAVRGSDARLFAARDAAIDARRAAEFKRAAALQDHRAEQRKLEGLLLTARAEAALARESVATLTEEVRKGNERTANARLVADTVQAELLAANDRLEKAYKDVAEMEKQLVDVSRMKNDLEQRLLQKQWPNGELPWFPDAPKIDGVVLGVSDKVNLILISVGGKDNVQVGFKFTVYRGTAYVSKIVVDKVEDGWAACSELTEFRKDKIRQGDSVSTMVFD